MYIRVIIAGQVFDLGSSSIHSFEWGTGVNIRQHLRSLLVRRELDGQHHIHRCICESEPARCFNSSYLFSGSVWIAQVHRLLGFLCVLK